MKEEQREKIDMTFGEDFPSLKENIYPPTFCRKGHRMYCSDKIKESCLDKQKVRDGFRKCIQEVRERLSPLLESTGQRIDEYTSISIIDELVYCYAMIIGKTYGDAKKELGL